MVPLPFLSASAAAPAALLADIRTPYAEVDADTPAMVRHRHSHVHVWLTQNLLVYVLRVLKVHPMRKVHDGCTDISCSANSCSARRHHVKFDHPHALLGAVCAGARPTLGTRAQ